MQEHGGGPLRAGGRLVLVPCKRRGALVDALPLRREQERAGASQPKGLNAHSPPEGVDKTPFFKESATCSSTSPSATARRSSAGSAPHRHSTTTPAGSTSSTSSPASS